VDSGLVRAGPIEISVHISTQLRRGPDALIAILDTGAQSTDLLTPWLTRYRAEIEAAGYPRQQRKSGGAGGVREVPGYVMPCVAGQVGGQDVVLVDVPLLLGHADAKPAQVANLGQDALNRFAVVVIDFASMAFELVRGPDDPGRATTGCGEITSR
jgi:hypothetical protein